MFFGRYGTKNKAHTHRASAQLSQRNEHSHGIVAHTHLSCFPGCTSDRRTEKTLPQSEISETPGRRCRFCRAGLMANVKKTIVAVQKCNTITPLVHTNLRIHLRTHTRTETCLHMHAQRSATLVVVGAQYPEPISMRVAREGFEACLTVGRSSQFVGKRRADQTHSKRRSPSLPCEGHSLEGGG